jgi:hypothetical protein
MTRISRTESDRLLQLRWEQARQEEAEIRQSLIGKRGWRAAVARRLLWISDRCLPPAAKAVGLDRGDSAP